MKNASKIARKLRDDRLAKCIERCEKPNENKGFREVGGDKPKRVSRPPRYDHFDNPPCIQFYQKSQSKSRKIARKLRERLLAKCKPTTEKPNKIKGFQEIT